MAKRRSAADKDRPIKRSLRIFAGDPMLGRTAGNRVTIEIDNEELRPGPRGSRVEVIDFDSANGKYYQPVDLDDPNVLMQHGLEPFELDPRFHQQMVFAVAMKTCENFDHALGRPITFDRPLRLLPHAFYGANAFFSEQLNAVLFGYFRADTLAPGPNLPGQTIFTCLSHDIVVHEVTHAIIARLRSNFLEPTNRDVLAFHEGFADLVALFQHFTYPEILRNEMQRTRTNLRLQTQLAQLAQQFGYATGAGRALRSALDESDPKLYQTLFEPHDRGSLLVGAVFDAFIETFQRRTRKIVRIATGGTGNLPDADLHPDFIDKMASEAAKTAQIVLSMCIRAFDYLPPVDVTFGDFLRALVTADYELYPEDSVGQRAALIHAFRRRGIYPEHVRSLAEESLLWDAPTSPRLRLRIDSPWVEKYLAAAAVQFSARSWWTSDRPLELKSELVDFARRCARDLLLDPERDIEVRGFHPVFRVNPAGRLVVEFVVQFVQTDKHFRSLLGGLPLRGGTTVIIAADGRVRYVIAKPILQRASKRSQASTKGSQRYITQLEYMRQCDLRDPQMTYASKDYIRNRMKLRMNLNALHGGLA